MRKIVVSAMVATIMLMNMVSPLYASQGNTAEENPSLGELIQQLASTNGGRFVLIAGAVAWLVVLAMYLNNRKKKKQQ